MNPFVAFLKLIRLPNLLIIVLTQYAIRYGVIYPYGYDLLMSNSDFFLLCLSTTMIAAAGYIINDYFDVKIDRVNRPTKIIIGKHIKRRIAMGAHVVINSIAILIGIYLAYRIGNWKLIFIQLCSVAVLWYYSTTFKRKVLIGNVFVALLAALVPLVVGVYEMQLQYAEAESTVNQFMFSQEPGTQFDTVMLFFKQSLENIMLWVTGFAFFAFLSTIVREIIKDIEDYDGDNKYGSNTFPVVFGKKKAKIVAQIFAIMMVVIISYLQFWKFSIGDMLSVMYFMFAVQAPLIFVIYKLQLASHKNDYTLLSNTMKGVMLLGIGYVIIFYYLISQLG